MRGKDLQSRRNSETRGITPAYAGKSLFVRLIRTITKDHPRLCGEKRMTRTPKPTPPGSPPPMRGKVYKPLHQPHDERITPAYAGKSPRCYKHCHCDGDHPRLCGEKTARSRGRMRFLGSPPPMRGKVLAGFHDTPHVRDHPRLCGEKAGTGSVLGCVLGSPPPMRGKANIEYQHQHVNRITPAYAGKRD